jgi:hypothetical protein
MTCRPAASIWWCARPGDRHLHVIAGLQGAVRESLKEALLALEHSGCEAAGCRLAGATVERLCVVHLYGLCRLLLAFPDSDPAVVIDVGEHLANDPARDIYARLYEVMGVAPTDKPRTKPPCCDDARQSPWTSDLVDDLIDAYRILSRRRRLRRQSRPHTSIGHRADGASPQQRARSNRFQFPAACFPQLPSAGQGTILALAERCAGDERPPEVRGDEPGVRLSAARQVGDGG